MLFLNNGVVTREVVDHVDEVTLLITYQFDQATVSTSNVFVNKFGCGSGRVISKSFCFDPFATIDGHRNEESCNYCVIDNKMGLHTEIQLQGLIATVARA